MKSLIASSFVPLVAACAAMLCSSLLTHSGHAEIKTSEIVYKHGDTTLTGFLAYDPDLVGELEEGEKLPGVLIVHQWMGVTDYEKRRARELAALGYVAFALDIYGTDHAPTDFQTAGAASGRFKNDRALFRERLNLGLGVLKANQAVDHDRIAAIGYCFGGTGVLELARSGAAIAGVVSFHGGLDSSGPDGGKDITAKVLILHGEDDPFVPVEGIDAMKKEFNQAGVDWQMISYSDTVHSFTQPMAGNKPELGYAYNERSDKRSWQHMRVFFDEIFDH